ncbi:MAG: hypothetical protein H6671_16750 [Anaerolineaceae bacterium]|nr:hypothetical protein [Anaerolineaceae bacterium]
MGYYLRFITTSQQAITVPVIAAALQALDPAYTLAGDQVDGIADLLHGETFCGVLEINRPGDDIFEDDLREFRDMVGTGETEAERRVLAVLANAQAMVAVEAIWLGTDSASVLGRLDPLWDWLFAHYPGLLQADNEGFYDADDLILERNFML